MKEKKTVPIFIDQETIGEGELWQDTEEVLDEGEDKSIPAGAGR